MKYDTRVAPGELVHNGRNEACCKWNDAPDPHVSSRGISEKFNVLDCLLEVIERGRSAIEQGPAVRGRLDALRVAVEQAHADSAFQFCDRSRNGWLACVEERCRLPHASGLHNDHQDVEVL